MVLVGGKKIGGDGLVDCSGEVGATSLTPHHLLPRLSEDRGRARVQGGVFGARAQKNPTRVSARTHLLV